MIIRVMVLSKATNTDIRRDRRRRDGGGGGGGDGGGGGGGGAYTQSRADY